MSKKGLTTSVLGSHLGFDVPAVVRRGSAPLHSVAAEETVEASEQGRAADADEPRVRAGEPAEAVAIAVETRPEAASAAANATKRAPAATDAHAGLDDDADEEDEPSREFEAEARRAASVPVARRKQPMKVESRSSVYRVGTQRSPYERADGTKTEKAGFTAPHGFKEELNLFCMTHRLGTTSEWIVATLRKEMERTRRKG